MTDKNAIKTISGLLQSAEAGAGIDVSAIVKQYPYFVPARYIQAATAHKLKAFSSEMLTAAYAYTGNWLMFLDHIQGNRKPMLADKPEEPAKVEETVIVAEVEEVELPQQAIEEVEAIVATEIIEEVEAEDVLDTADVSAPVEIKEEQLTEHVFAPAQSDDYFFQQGIKISRDLPENIDEFKVINEEHNEGEDDGRDKSLMVMMSFTEWLLHFKTTAEKKNSELEDQKAIRTMWQKEKLAAALEEENDEIPENVFEMAVNSIAKEEGLASESLADIYMKQGKYDQAIEMYKKLSLRNPQKNAYFARKIEEILKEK